MRVFINYKQNTNPDHEFAEMAETRLRSDGHHVFRDETNLKPSEEWARRLEEEVRACNAMVSIVSNASLRSGWVLNEIDLAIKLEKRMLPVIIEDLDESLRFQAFNTRFMSIQWIKKTNDLHTLCEQTSAALQEIRLACYQDLLKAKLGQYGISDGGEILEALFGVLYQAHWPAVLTGNANLFDSHTRLNGDLARSLAESLRNHVETIASMKDHNAANSHKEGYNERSLRLSWQVQRLKCLADLLNTLVVAWNQNSERKRDTIIPPGQNEAYIFDDSDGEQEFAARGASPIQGGTRDKPVPVGEITHMVKLQRAKAVEQAPVRQEH